MVGILSLSNGLIIILFLLVDSYQMVATIRYMPVDISDYIRLYPIRNRIERIERRLGYIIFYMLLLFYMLLYAMVICYYVIMNPYFAF